MPVFHAPACEANAPTPRQSFDELRCAFGELLAQLLPDSGFEDFERKLHALFAQAEREVTAHALERLDVNVPAVVIDGRRHRRVLRSSTTYTSAAGPVSVWRTLYRAGSEKAVVPLELRAGVVHGQWTPLAARQASFMVAHMTPQECENTLRELGNMMPSKSSLDRLPKALSKRWEADRERHETALRQRTKVAREAVTVAVSLDGVMVPMKDGERQAKRTAARAQGKRTKGPAGYQEVGCGTVSTYDADGERLSTIRLARMPESKKVTLKTMLSAELGRILARRPDLTVVKVADGARDNWTFLSELAPGGEERVDFFHAVEQLKGGLDAAYGENNLKGTTQFDKLRRLLREAPNGVAKVIRSLTYLRDKHPRRKRIGEVLGYFRRHRERMDYADAATRNLPIGSGVIEATCKSLATQRLKRSGMRWRHAGGQAILTLRALVQSNRFDHAWKLLSATFRSEVTTPDNVVAYPSARAA